MGSSLIYRVNQNVIVTHLTMNFYPFPISSQAALVAELQKSNYQSIIMVTWLNYTNKNTFPYDLVLCNKLSNVFFNSICMSLLYSVTVLILPSIIATCRNSFFYQRAATDWSLNTGWTMSYSNATQLPRRQVTSKQNPIMRQWMMTNTRNRTSRSYATNTNTRNTNFK